MPVYHCSLDLNAILITLRGQMSTVAIRVVCMFLAAGCLVQSTAQSPSASEEGLKKFLQKYDGNPASPDERTTRYSAATVDLRDDGASEVIVYLIGPRWCGSGGCSMLVLAPEGTSYKVITKTTVTQPPVRVLLTKTNGWHDLGVRVQGGGIQPGYEARLAFNGRKYPGNPSVPPAQKLHKKVEGKEIISADAKGTPLW